MSKLQNAVDKSAQEIRFEIAKIPEAQRWLWDSYLQALDMKAALQKKAVAQITRGGSGNELMSFALCDDAKRLASVCGVIEAIEISPDFKEAKKQVKPLLAKLKAAEESEADARRKEAAAAHELKVKKQAAIDAALQSVEKRFATTT